MHQAPRPDSRGRRVAFTLIVGLVAAACAPGDGAPAATASPSTTQAQRAPSSTSAASSPDTSTRASPGTPSPEPAQPEWTRIKGMTIPRSEMAGVAIDGLIYVPGGFVGGVGGARGDSAVEAYDPSTDTWTSFADLPQPRHHAMAAAHGGLLYVFGGFGDRAPTDTSWVFDPASGEWAPVAPMPHPVAAGAAATLGDHIYVMGGIPSGTSVIRYEPAANTWERLPDLTTAREHTAAVAYVGRIYAIAGRWGGEETASVEVFDPDLGSWAEAPPLVEPRAGFGATVWRNTVVVAGGELLSGNVVTLTSVESFDGERWAALPALPVPLHGLAMAAVDDGLYVLGGSRRAGAVANSADALVWLG